MRTFLLALAVIFTVTALLIMLSHHMHPRPADELLSSIGCLFIVLSFSVPGQGNRR